MARCYAYIDLDSLAADLYFLAEEVGRITPTDLGKSASIKMYNGLLEMMEDTFFDGDIKPTLIAASADPEHEFHQVWNDLKRNNVLVRTSHPNVGAGNIDMATDPFGATINVVEEVFAQYKASEAEEVTPTPPPSTPTAPPEKLKTDLSATMVPVDNDTIGEADVEEIYPEEKANDEDLQEMSVTDDTRSIRSLIRDLLGPKRAGMQDDLISFFQNIVSTSYVDNKVNPDGSIKGFKSVEDVATTVKARLGNITTNFIRKSANEIVNVRDAEGFGTILYFDKGRPMSGAYEVKTVKDEDGKDLYTEYRHPMLQGTDKKYRIVVPARDGDTVDDVIDYMSVEEDTDIENFDVDDNHISSNFAIDSAFGTAVNTDPRVKRVFFAQAILKGNNFNVFLKAFNKPLHTAYKEQHRSGHENGGTFSSEDQDSKTIRMLKTTTPRVLVGDKGKLYFDTKNPFLTEQDFNAVASELHRLPRDLEGFRKGVEKLMKAAGPEADVYASIYYRFFAPEDYSIDEYVDPITGKKAPATFRSLNSILTNNTYNGVTPEQYLEVANDYEGLQSLKSGNALIGNAMSALMTSLSSTTPAEKVLYRNGRAMTTNTRGGEIMIIRKQDFISKTTDSIGENRRTKDSILRNIKITDTNGKHVDFQIKQPGTRGFFEFSATVGDINNKGVASKKRLITKFETEADIAPVQMMQLAAQFGLPAELTTPSNIAVIKQILSANFPGEAKTIFNNFYLNMILTTAANGKAENPVTETLLKVTHNPTVHNTPDGTRFDVFGLNYAFNDSLQDILSAISGRQQKKFIISNDGNKLASLIPKNKVKDTANLIEKLKSPNTLHTDRLFTSGMYQALETYSKTGTKMGEDSKGNSEMTRLEQNQFLIEGAFLGRLEETNWKNALFQMGTMSDRSDIQLVDVKTLNAGDKFIPISKDGTLDGAKLLDEAYKSKFKYFENVERQVNSKWTDYLGKLGIAISPNTSIFEIAKAVDEAGLDFNKVQAESGLVANAMLAKGGKVAYIKPDTKKLVLPGIQRILEQEGVMPEGADKDTVIEIFNSLKLPYSNSLKALGAASFTKTIIPNSTLQNIALFKDEKMAKEWIKQNRLTFRRRMDDLGYDRISRKSVQAINNRFERELDPKAARDILLDSYFYYSSTLGSELLDMHTGGFIQFKSKAGYTQRVEDMFNIKADGTTELKAPKAIIDKFKSRKVVNKSTNKKQTLGKFSVKTAVESFGIDSEEVYQLSIIKNKNLSDAQKARLLYFSDLSQGNHLKYVDQVKRNAMMGSSHQMPRLSGKNEPGVLLSQYSHNVTVDDPNIALKLLGKSGKYFQDVYDAVQMAHPLYFLKLNGSLGNHDSNFMANGVAVKDITNEIDDAGWLRGQKKATFDMFNNELMENGSKELYDLFTKMNTAMEFQHKTMMVPTGNSEFATLTLDQWLNNGVSLGLLKDTKTDTMVDARTLYESARTNPKAVQADLESGRYQTTKQEVSFDNMQDLWEFFGAFENKNAWAQIAELLGNHAGNATKVDLSDATYDNRDAYIEKVGVLSQEKMGSKNIVPDTALTDPSYGFMSEDGMQRWSTIDNTYHGVILQAEHSPDTTGSMEGSVTYEGDHGEDSTVSLITQIISANVGQGESVEESARIYDTLNTLSSAFLLKLADKIATDAREIGEAAGFDERMMEQLEIALQNINDPKAINQADAKAVAAVDEAIGNYVTDIVREALKTREDAGTTGEILSDQYVQDISFDLKMTLPLAQSSINSKFNRGTVRMKFKGGQFVVSPSHDFIKSYSIGGRTGLNRSELNRLLTLPESNTREGGVNPDLAAVLAEIPLTQITKPEQLRHLKPSDKLVGPNGEVVNIQTLRKQFRETFKPEQGQSFQQMFDLELISKGYSTRLVDENGDMQVPQDNRLKWQEYYSYDAEGNRVSAIETEEYETFNNANLIGDEYSDVVKGLKGSGLKPGSAEYQAAVREGMAKHTGLITKQAFREWYFNAGPGVANSVDGEYTPEMAQHFETLYADYKNAADIYNSARDKTSVNMHYVGLAESYNKAVVDAAVWIGENMDADPFFRKKFEKDLYDMLEDRDDRYGWVAEPAEFYMPSLVYKSFFIEHGDNLLDILGPQEQPDSKPLVSMGIISTDQAFELDRNFSKAAPEILRVTLGVSEKAAVNKYIAAKEAQLDHMRKFFKNKLEKAYKGDKALNDAFKFKSTDNLRKLAGEITRKIEKSVPGSELHKAYSDLYLDVTETIENSRRSSLNKHSIATGSALVDAAIDEYILKKAARIADNFTQSLEFITARIPAQGKQSYVAAKTKNFVHHTKNSCYGPLEMLTITGADYDIDKQNMMTWAVDDEGVIVDWKPFLNSNGRFVRTVLDDDIKEKSAQLTAEVQKKADRMIARYNKLQEKFDKSTNPEENAKIQNEMDKLRQEINDLQPRLSERIESMKKALEENFVMAGQNYVVYNLMKTIKDPKNGIEAATPVSMDKVGSGKTKTDYSTLETSTRSTDYYVLHDYALPYDPYTFTNYERINMDGKIGVGIFASDLKSYFATYYAFINSTPSEAPYIKFNSDLETNAVMNEHYDINPDAIQFFKKIVNEDGEEGVETQNITELANTAKHLPKGREMSKRLDKMRSEIVSATPEEQVRILTEHIDDVKAFNGMKVEEQAWEDLSELLSAATDNAKELILGRIGANGNTNSIISTMIRLGIDLKDALYIINNPQVKPLVAQVEAQSDLILKQKAKESASEQQELYEDTFSSLEKLLEKEVKNRSIPEKPGKDADAYLTDPVRQMLVFTKIAGEFGTVAKMLSINQGLQNGAFEAWDFVDKINKSVNKVISETEGEPFDLREFVMMAIRAKTSKDEKAEKYVHDVMSRYNTAKKGINVPYVLYKNSHYFSYFQAAFEAKNMRDRTSKVFSTVESIIDKARKHAGEDLKIEDSTYKRLADFVYSAGIQRYFKNSTFGGKIRLHGSEYDLSTAEGRTQFLEEFPAKFNQIMTTDFEGKNEFTLFQGEPLIDYATKKKIDVLRGPDLNNIDSMMEAKLDNALNGEGGIIDDSELYNALFAYGLIVGKGGYNKGSFIGLFKPEKYMDFVRFIKKNSDDIVNQITNIDEVVRLNNPMLLPAHNTTTGSSRFAPKSKARMGDEDQQFDEDWQEYDANEGYSDTDGAMYNRKSYVDVSYRAYDTSDINEGRLAGEAVQPKGAHITHDYIRSRQTGLVHSWDKGLQLYVPLVREVPDVAIPFTLKPTGKKAHLDAGYVEGWSAELPGGKTGNILAYVDPYVKGIAKTNTRIENLLKTRPDINEKFNHFYIVKDEHGKYEIYEKKELLELNPSAILDEHKIIVQQTDATFEPQVSTNRNLFRDKSGRFYATSGEGRTSTFVRVQANERARGSMAAKYDPEFFSEMKVENPVKYDLGKVNSEYRRWRHDFVISALAEQRNISLEYATNLVYEGVQRGSLNYRYISKIERYLNKIAPPSEAGEDIGTKLKTLMKGESGLKAEVKKYLGDKNPSRGYHIDTNFPPGKNITAINQIYQDPDFIGALSLDELSTLLKGQTFDRYMNKVFLPNSEYNMVSMSNGRVYVGDQEESSDSFLDRMANESREYQIPKDLRNKYSKDVSPAAMKRMIRYMNSRFPENKWRALTTTEIEARYGHKLSKAKGFTLNGEVIINLDKATLETPIHEFSHIYLAHVKENDIDLYNNLTRMALDHELAEHMKKAYPDLSSTDLGEEVFIELVSLHARGELDSNNPKFKAIGLKTGTVGKMFSKIVEFFDRLFGGMLGRKKDENLGLTLQSSLLDAVEAVGDRVAFGTDSVLNDFSHSTKQKVRKLFTGAEINLKESKELLMKQGFIQYRCN